MRGIETIVSRRRLKRFQLAAEADDVLPARQSFGDESIGYGLKGDERDFLGIALSRERLDERGSHIANPASSRSGAKRRPMIGLPPRRRDSSI
jgi:hypothetical protein